MEIQQWAKDQQEKMLKDIKFYISKGIEKKIALEMVLSASTVGSGIKAQIRYEVKSI